MIKGKILQYPGLRARESNCFKMVEPKSKRKKLELVKTSTMDKSKAKKKPETAWEMMIEEQRTDEIAVVLSYLEGEINHQL